MDSQQQVSPIRVHYPLLLSDPSSVSSQIQQAFGSAPGSLGIILIDELPSNYSELRATLFHLIHRLGNLPEDEREKLARPDTSYLFGWSHGKEVMNGRPDTQKGSFYVNPLIDLPDVNDEKRAAHPEYYAGNVWPRDIPSLEQFEPTCKALGKIVYDVGLALARACQPFVEQASSSASSVNVESLIASSQSNKARLLHYYPDSTSVDRDAQLAQDSLCGTHIDHSLLTGLCSAMYLSQTAADYPPSEVPAPTSSAGLYIHPRPPAGSVDRASAIKVAIPANCLAFQIGEALELLTDGRLAATPHFVSGSPATDSSELVSRETFAFFLQPDVDDVIGADGDTFGGFTKRVLGRHYSAEKAVEEAEN